MNQPGGMGMPGYQSKGGGMSQQRLNATMVVGTDLGIMDMDTAITNISIIGTDTLGIYIALGNVGVRICATKDWQAS